MRTIAPPDLASSLRLAVTRTARRLRQEAGGELSPSQSAALACIDRHGPLTPSELAARERIQRPSATRMLALLEERGLIARTADPRDRRSTQVAVTPDGTRLLAALRDRKDAYLTRRLRELEPEELDALARAVDVLERLLEEDRA
jgi:DNA-binding MarR family transcriptional regulator